VAGFELDAEGRARRPGAGMLLPRLLAQPNLASSNRCRSSNLPGKTGRAEGELSPGGIDRVILLPLSRAVTSLGSVLFLKGQAPGYYEEPRAVLREELTPRTGVVGAPDTAAPRATEAYPRAFSADARHRPSVNGRATQRANAICAAQPRE